MFLSSFNQQRFTRARPVWAIIGFTVLSLLSIIFLYGNIYRRTGIVYNNNDGSPTYELLTCVYFSAITFTTVGYGDYHPVSELARLAASVEALSGYILLGLLVASLSNMVRPRNAVDDLTRKLDHMDARLDRIERRLSSS